MKVFYCKSLNKRAYEYKGQELNKAWKFKEEGGEVLYDTYEDYLEATKPKPKPKRVVKKKAAVKKEVS